MEAQSTNPVAIQMQLLQSTNADRIETCNLLSDDTSPNLSNTYITCTTNQGEPISTPTTRRTYLEILIYITEVVLIICALVVAVALFTTLSTVGIAVTRMYSNHTLKRPPVENPFTANPEST